MPATGMLKYGSQNIDSLLFDKCIEEKDFDFDFRTWTLNEANSAGVTVTENTIVVTKVKPKEWFIRSNYGYTTSTERNAGFLNKIFRLSGLQALWTSGDITVVTDHPTGDVSQNYQPVGLVISPIRTSDGLMLSHAYPWDMNIPNGYWKHVYGYEYGQSWNVYGYGYDEDRALYNYSCEYNEFPEVAFAFWTGATPDNEGYVTLTTPFTISLPNHAITDPSSVEGYKASVGSTVVYDKPMTFQNVLMAHGLAFEENGTYTEDIQGHYDVINPNGSIHKAYVISGRGYSGTYEHLRMPEITNFSTLIQQGFPFKFWAQLERDSDHTCIWDSLATAFNNTTITDPNFPEHLFSKSTGDISTLNLTINPGLDSGGQDSIVVDISSIFDYSNFASTVNFTFTTGVIKSLHNAFRQTKRLTAVTFNKLMRITEWHGAFEGTALTDFPANLAPADMWPDDATLSEPTCNLNYAADGSELTWFGNYQNASAQNPGDKCYTAVVSPGCFGAFRSNSLTEIRYLLDMKFVAPIAWNIIDDGPDVVYNNAVFYAPNLTTAYIKNLNKGDWSLDGVKRTNSKGETLYAGNLDSLNADSINYMLSNLFDLRLNSSDPTHYETQFNSFNSSKGWSNSKGLRRPITFATAEDGTTLTNTLSSSGTMEVVLTLTNCTLSLTNGGSTRTISGNETLISLDSGACTFTFNITTAGQPMNAVIQLSEPFKAELTSGLSSANIYLPASASTKISSAALTEANARGWTVYVGGTPFTGS